MGNTSSQPAPQTEQKIYNINSITTYKQIPTFFETLFEQLAIDVKFSYSEAEYKSYSLGNKFVLNDMTIADIMYHSEALSSYSDKLELMRNVIIPTLSKSLITNDTALIITDLYVEFFKRRASYFISCFNQNSNVNLSATSSEPNLSLCPSLNASTSSDGNTNSEVKLSNQENEKIIHDFDEKFFHEFIQKNIYWMKQYNKVPENGELDINTILKLLDSPNTLQLTYDAFMWGISRHDINLVVKSLKCILDISIAEKVSKQTFKTLNVYYMALFNKPSNMCFEIKENEMKTISLDPFLVTQENSHSILAKSRSDIYLFTPNSILTVISLATTKDKRTNRLKTFNLSAHFPRKTDSQFIVATDQIILIGDYTNMISCLTRPFSILPQKPTYASHCPPIKTPATSDGNLVYSLTSNSEISVYYIDIVRIVFIRQIKLKRGTAPLLLPYSEALIPPYWEFKSSLAVNGHVIQFITIMISNEAYKYNHFIRSFSLIDGSHIQDTILTTPYPIHSWIYDSENYIWGLSPYSTGSNILQYKYYGPSLSNRDLYAIFGFLEQHRDRKYSFSEILNYIANILEFYTIKFSNSKTLNFEVNSDQILPLICFINEISIENLFIIDAFLSILAENINNNPSLIKYDYLPLIKSVLIKISESRQAHELVYSFVDDIIETIFYIDHTFISQLVDLILPIITPQQLYLFSRHYQSKAFCYLFSIQSLKTSYTDIIIKILYNRHYKEQSDFIIHYHSAIFTQFVFQSKEIIISNSKIPFIPPSFIETIVNNLFEKLINFVSNPKELNDEFFYSQSDFIDLFRRLLVLIRPIAKFDKFSLQIMDKCYPFLKIMALQFNQNRLTSSDGRISLCYELMVEVFEFWFGCLVAAFKGSDDVKLIKKYSIFLKESHNLLSLDNWESSLLVNIDTIIDTHVTPDFDIKVLMEFIYKKIQNPFNRRLNNEDKEFEGHLMIALASHLNMIDKLQSLCNLVASDQKDIIISPQIRQLVQAVYKVRGDLRASKQATIQYEEIHEEGVPPKLKQQYEKYKNSVKEKVRYLLSFVPTKTPPDNLLQILTDFILSEITMNTLVSLIDSLENYMSNIMKAISFLEDLLMTSNNALIYALCSEFGSTLMLYDSLSLLGEFSKNKVDLLKHCHQIIYILVSLIQRIPGNAIFSLVSDLILFLCKFESEQVYNILFALFQNLNIYFKSMHLDLYKALFTFLCYFHRTLVDSKLLRLDIDNVNKIIALFQKLPKEATEDFMVAQSIIHGYFNPNPRFIDLAYISHVNTPGIKSYCYYLYEVTSKGNYIDKIVPQVLLIIGSVFCGCSSHILSQFPSLDNIYSSQRSYFCKTPLSQINFALELIKFIRKLLISPNNTVKSTVIQIFDQILSLTGNFEDENTVKQIIGVYSVFSNVIDPLRPFTIARDQAENRLYFVLSMNEPSKTITGVVLPITSALKTQSIQVNDSFNTYPILQFSSQIYTSDILLKSIVNILFNLQKNHYSDCLLSFFAESCLNEYLSDIENGEKISNTFINSVPPISIKRFIYKKHSSLVMSLIQKSLMSANKGIFVGSPLKPKFYHASFTHVVHHQDYTLDENQFITRYGMHIFVTSVVDDKYPSYFVIHVNPASDFIAGIINHSIHENHVKIAQFDSKNDVISMNGEKISELKQKEGFIEFRFHPQKCKISLATNTRSRRVFSRALPSTLCSFFIIVNSNQRIIYKCSVEATSNVFKKKAKFIDIFNPPKLVKHVTHKEILPTQQEYNQKNYKMIDLGKSDETDHYESYVIIKDSVKKIIQTRLFIQPVEMNIKNMISCKSFELPYSLLPTRINAIVSNSSYNPNVLTTPLQEHYYYEVSNNMGTATLLSANQVKIIQSFLIPPLHFKNFQHLPAEILNCYFSGVCNLHREEVLTLLFIRNIKNEESLKYFQMNEKQLVTFVVQTLLLLEPIKFSNLRESKSPISFDINSDSDVFASLSSKAELYDYQIAMNNIIKIVTSNVDRCKSFLLCWYKILIKMMNNELFNTVLPSNSEAIIISPASIQSFIKKYNSTNNSGNNKAIEFKKHTATGWIVFAANLGENMTNKIALQPNSYPINFDTGYYYVEGDNISLQLNYVSPKQSTVILPVNESTSSINSYLLDTFFELMINFKYFVLFLEKYSNILEINQKNNIFLRLRDNLYTAIGAQSPFFYTHDSILLKFINEHLPIDNKDITTDYIQSFNILIQLTNSTPHQSLKDYINEIRTEYDDFRASSLQAFLKEEETPEIPDLPNSFIPSSFSPTASIRNDLMSLKRVLLIKQPKDLLSFPIHLILTDWVESFATYPPVDINAENDTTIKIKFTIFKPQSFLLIDSDQLIDVNIKISNSIEFDKCTSLILNPILTGRITSQNSIFVSYPEDVLFIKFPDGYDITNHHFIVATKEKPKDMKSFAYSNRVQLISDIKEMTNHWSKFDDKQILAHITPAMLSTLSKQQHNSFFEINKLAMLTNSHRTHLWNLRSTILVAFNYLSYAFKETTESESFAPYKQFISMTMIVPQFQQLIQDRSALRFSYQNLVISRRDGLDVRNGVSRQLNKSMICQFSEEYNKNPENFRSAKRPFHISFDAENGVDYGGLMREFATELAKDISEPNIGLFIHTPNNREQKGSFRDSLIPSPDPSLNQPEKVYYAVGGLIAISMRTGLVQPFTFPPLFWEYLSGSELTPNHIYQIDEDYRQLITSLQQAIDSKISEENFAQTFNLRPVYIDSRGTEHNIRQLQRITTENCARYIALCHEARISELKRPLDSIKRGFWENIKTTIPSYVTPDLLEHLACGDKVIDVRQLQQITNLSISKPQRQLFWESISRMSNEQRKQLLQFSTGSMILPTNLKKTYLTVDRAPGDIDTRLPTSSTCFCRLHMPEYSSTEKMFHALILAIENTGTFENS
ncbi:hypothetical protein TRFO_38969 [Tritrichomonas foetus]|uniref:HECT domain-containing protein n=1 Tax=Tritrichomonas foetus TaxID=1144522 RepID=A0A1J4JC43_9EUKA|nr:hypothetical protein TRFO_38969 [Tritrichomonas foetus]|eukprot:OHS94828.1 hypothetical protein TRFO_38969 [Tritrichomonas foetus]